MTERCLHLKVVGVGTSAATFVLVHLSRCLAAKACQLKDGLPPPTNAGGQLDVSFELDNNSWLSARWNQLEVTALEEETFLRESATPDWLPPDHWVVMLLPIKEAESASSESDQRGGGWRFPLTRWWFSSAPARESAVRSNPALCVRRLPLGRSIVMLVLPDDGCNANCDCDGQKSPEFGARSLSDDDKSQCSQLESLHQINRLRAFLEATLKSPTVPASSATAIFSAPTPAETAKSWRPPVIALNSCRPLVGLKSMFREIISISSFDHHHPSSE